jgi:integrase
MPWRSPSRSRSEPGAAARQAPFAGGRLLTVMMPRGYYRPAGIDKRVSMHTLRHCFATHLLEQKVDIRIIQALLGHKKLDTTVIYTQVATDLLREVVSPLEMLQPA